jgi:hypothetical protein
MDDASARLVERVLLAALYRQWERDGAAEA